jgi:UDP-galactopyranose mutase
MSSVAVVGAGFSGAVIARELALSGWKVTVFDVRNHVAGNCHTQRDRETGVMIHVYGPHVFHTSNEEVWKYVQQFDAFLPYTNRVKAIYRGRVYSLPVNLLTINSFFATSLSPKEAQAFIEQRADKSIENPASFEEQALRLIGRELYEAFFKEYTTKQWGVRPSELPASLLKRLPVRFNYDDNYYSSRFQGMPEHGYTHVVQRMLDHRNIEVCLNTRFGREIAADYGHVFYSGPIDAWFGYSEGRLGYRTLDFELERHEGDYQGNAVVNYCEAAIPWTRISEHKHFAPWESHDRTVIYKEFSRCCGEQDVPYYPIRLVKERSLLARYKDLARDESSVTFVGRLGTYRYLDMDVSIEEALTVARYAVKARAGGRRIPSFLVDPLT